MSTAVELLDQGYEVDIYEQRPFIGGKVASFRDKDGNHIEMGCVTLISHLMTACSGTLQTVSNVSAAVRSTEQQFKHLHLGFAATVS